MRLPPKLSEITVICFIPEFVVIQVEAGAGFGPVLHHQWLALVTAKWVYTRARFKSREVRRLARP